MGHRLARRLLVIGWDAADWQMVTPLMDAGLMPTLAKLVAGGVMGNLATLHPVLSPLLWTSIATGKRAPKHGIYGFTEPRPDGAGIQPVSSTSRKTKALWNILSQNGLSSLIVNWYASHPAEPIRGCCVSEAFARSVSTDGQELPVGAVHPERLRETVADLRVMPRDITGHDIAPFVPALGEIPAEQTGPISGIRKMLARCATTHAVATELLEREPWDFAAVYYDAIDHFGHGFMHYHPPKLAGIPEVDFERYKGVMTGIYRFHDMMLERLLQLAGPEATVMLVSDHGFLSGALRPVNARGEIAGPESWHRDHGVFLLSGPGIRKDERIYGATLLDVAPTALALLGLPAGGDMDGRVLAECFETPEAAGALETVDSWDAIEGPHDAGQHPAEVRVDPADQQAALQQLVDLGYIEAPDADVSRTIALTNAEAARNLAASHADAGNHARAAELLEPLVAADPRQSRYATALAQAYFMLGRYDDARATIARASDGGADEGMGGAAREAGAGGGRSPYMNMLLGSIELAEGNLDAAMAHLREAEKYEPRVPAVHIQIGNTYARQRLWDDAARSFQRALELNPDEAKGHYGLGFIALRQGRYEEAAARSLKAVGLTHFFPRAHLQLGVALARLGKYDRAIQAMETCLAMRPHSIEAHRYLAATHLKAGNVARSKHHHDITRSLQTA